MPPPKDLAQKYNVDSRTAYRDFVRLACTCIVEKLSDGTSLARQRLASITEVKLARIKQDRFHYEVPGRHIALYWRHASQWSESLETFGDFYARC